MSVNSILDSLDSEINFTDCPDLGYIRNKFNDLKIELEEYEHTLDETEELEEEVQQLKFEIDDLEEEVDRLKQERFSLGIDILSIVNDSISDRDKLSKISKLVNNLKCF